MEAHHESHAEQVRLLELAAAARTVNRPAGQPREVMFGGGDLHAVGMFEGSFVRIEVNVAVDEASGRLRLMSDAELLRLAVPFSSLQG